LTTMACFLERQLLIRPCCGNSRSFAPDQQRYWKQENDETKHSYQYVHVEQAHAIEPRSKRKEYDD
jgi:hypothetical protein